MSDNKSTNKKNNVDDINLQLSTELDALLDRTERAQVAPQQQNQLTSNDPLVLSPNRQRAQTHAGHDIHKEKNNNRGGPRRPGPITARHRRNQTSLGEIVLSTVREGLSAEASVLRASMSQKLRDAQHGRGDSYFLDMSMTRSLSILPEDIPDLFQQIIQTRGAGETKEEQAETDALITDTATDDNSDNMLAWGRYASLFGAVLAVSSNGTALALLDGVPPPLKLYWRMTATASVLSVITLKTIFYNNNNKQEEGSYLRHLTGVEWFTVAGAVVCFALQMLFYYFALEYTTIGNAVIGANSQAILLLLGKLVSGQRVLALELAGVVVASGGALFCASEEARDESSNTTRTIIGDLLALCAGVLGVGYMTFAKACRPLMPVTVFMFLVMALGSILVLLFMLVAPGFTVSFSADPYDGIFGWTSTREYRLYIILHVALICNILGTMGFLRAMEYFDNIVISVATLLEPMIATLIAFIVGVGSLPGPMGWAGNALVASGTLAVVYPSLQKRKNNDTEYEGILEYQQQSGCAVDLGLNDMGGDF